MNPKVVEIADAIARCEDLSYEDFKFIRGYIFICNKFKSWRTDDVLSNFMLDIRQNYNPDFDTKQKELWLYAHIKKAISDMARFDNYGTLHNPVPVIIDINWHNIPVSSEVSPEKSFEISEWLRLIESLKEIIRDWFEMDIYIECIVWNTPLSTIASQWWKSAERWRVTKDKIIGKLKLYIENYR